MLRFGIVSTLVWHYTVDAVLMGTFLFQSDNWYFRLSGLVVGGVVLFPLALSLASYFRRGGFLPDGAVVNAGLDQVALHAAQDSPAAAHPPGMTPAPEVAHSGSWPRRWVYVLAGVAVLAALVVRPVRFGSWIEVKAARPQVEAAADAAMRARGIDPAAWMRVAQFLTNLNGSDFEYLRQVAGAGKAVETLRARTASGLWRVRYFRPERREEWQVILTSDARLYRVDHELDEKAPGARLGAAEALELARRHVESRGVALVPYRLVDSQQEQKDNRTDHYFVWEDTSFHLGAARARLSLRLLGNEPTEFRRFLKLPEEWLRNFTRPRLQGFLMPGLIGAVGLPLLIVFLRRLSGHHGPGTLPHRYHWRVYLGVAAAAAALSVASEWNGAALALASYDTATPLANFTAGVWIARLLGVLFHTVLGLGAAMAFDVFWQLKFGAAGFARPSARLALVLAVLVAAGGSLLPALGQLLPGPRLSVPLWSPPDPDVVLPALAVLEQSFLATLAAATLGGIAVLGEMRYLKMRGQWVFLGLICIVMAASSAQTVVQFAGQFLITALALAALLLVFECCGGDVVSYMVAFFWAQAAVRALGLLGQPSAWLRGNGAAALVVAALLGWWLIRRRQTPVGY
jgi:hypothetical protein